MLMGHDKYELHFTLARRIEVGLRALTVSEVRVHEGPRGCTDSS